MSPKAHQIPWEKVTANTLRNICRDLGIVGHQHSRDEMSTVLRQVENDGLESVLQEQEVQKEKSVKTSTTRAASKAAPRPKRAPTKRPSTQVETSLSPRRSRREPRLSEKRKASIITSKSPARAASTRRRGPRTSAAATRKALFDGVVLSTRRRSRASSQAETDGERDGDAQKKSFTELNADGEDGMQVDA